MTAPVFRYKEGKEEMMAFAMPGDMSFDQVPTPDDSNVEVVQIESGSFAVKRYSGCTNSEKEKQQL